MDCHRALVDVLLLADCNLYERYPELVQRVDYFLYDWCDETLARTECLLRRQFRSQRAAEAAGGASGDDESFTHKRSVNIVWRQWAVNRLQLPQYPPERINWNKDADPVFLYGQVPALRLEVPWSTHSTTPSPPGGTQRPAGLQLKPALKRTDLQTYLTSPTLSPASSPLQSPTLSLRENMSTSSFGSDATLESENALKPRLRFNDHVEQCMVVFDQEKEYLPTDDDGGGGGSDNDGAAAAAGKKRMALKRPGRRPRRSLVIKLAPTHLKGDHRKLVAVSTTAGSAYAAAGYDSDEEALFGAYDDSFAMFGNLPPSDSPPSGRAGAGVGVGGYVQGYVKSVAGQVRKLVGDAVMGSSSSSSYASDSRTSAPLSPPTAIVSDPFAAHHRQSAGDAQSPAATDARSRAMGARGSSMDIDCVDSARMVPAPLDVVRDPYSSASDSKSSPSDCVPFDDDEDAIIHEFEREMQRCTASTQSSYYSLQKSRAGHGETWAIRQQQPAVREPAVADWDMDDGMYESEYQLHMYDSDHSNDYGSELGPAAHVGLARPLHASFRAGMVRDNYRPAAAGRAAVPERPAAAAADPRQQRHVRNDSIIDRAEDTIVNTVDAVKWCASFISNYTIF